MTMPVSAVMADRAPCACFRCWPRLNVVRMWSGIRVMTAGRLSDLRPVDDVSRRVRRRCHSGVTLAANHALTLAPMIAAGRSTPRSSVPSARGGSMFARLPDDARARDRSPSRSTASAHRRAARATRSPPPCSPPASTIAARRRVSGAPRAPYCMMGVCFDCLVTIDGVGNRQGCLVPVREGMRDRDAARQAGARHDDAPTRLQADAMTSSSSARVRPALPPAR